SADGQGVRAVTTKLPGTDVSLDVGSSTRRADSGSGSSASSIGTARAPDGIGARLPKSDGGVKADGSGIYADDLSFPRMLHAKFLRSPHAHARIRNIDVSKALAYPGVVASLVGSELPARYGVIPWTHDEQALATDKVRFIGDEVA